MLRTIRIILAVIFFTSITLLFLDYTGTLKTWIGWTANMQFLPALLSFNIISLVGILLLTFLFGRLYCSTICPLGVLQDMISWWAGKRKKMRFSWIAAKNRLRYLLLILFLVLFAIQVGTIALFIAPYSAYGRMVSQLLTPLVLMGNNILGIIADKLGFFIPGPVEYRPFNCIMFCIALISFIMIFVFAWRKGRLYCNTICPVGTILGLISRHAFYKPQIHDDKCVHCGLCSKTCKSSCIDSENKTIDYSRCVVCGDCLKVCRTKAIQFEVLSSKTIESSVNADGIETKSVETKSVETANRSVVNVTEGKILESKGAMAGRRGFLTGFVLLISAKLAGAQTSKEKEYQQRGDGGRTPLKDRKCPDRETKIIPPGAGSPGHFYHHCTACQLCITACPNHILRPSSNFKNLMQPEITFENGWCRSECVECSKVCPTGAIRPITVPDKSARKIGFAVYSKDLCIVQTDHVQCDACARHCPTEAIFMVPLHPKDANSRKIPAIDSERCIGCGACEYLCPVRPLSAIHVEGIERHRTI